MATKKKKNKKNKSLYIFPVLFVIVCLSYFFRFLFYNIDTEIVRKDSVENLIEAEAVFIKNEWVASFAEGVQVNYLVSEGEKVSFDRKLMEIVKSDNADENLSVKISELNKRIEEIKKADINNNFFSQDKEKIAGSIRTKAQQLKDICRSGNLANLEQSKDELAANLYKKSLVYGNDSFFGKNYDQLIKERDHLMEVQKNNINEVLAKTAGIASFELDGMEQLLNPANIGNFNVKGIEEIREKILGNQKSKSKKDKTSGIKVVDNFEWYISCVVKTEDIKGIEKGRTLKLRFKELDGAVVRGRVFLISNPEGDSCVMSIRVDEHVKDFYKTRLTKVDIIKANYEGFAVPVKSLIVKGESKGVFVVKDGIVRYVPVKVLTYDDKYILVDNADKKESGSEEGSGVILRVGDEVVTTVKRVRDNQILPGRM